MVLKIWLENTRDLHWVAVLLDRTVPAIESETPTVASEAGSVSGASAALASPPPSDPL
jgi:hypothetical protein